MTNVSPSQPVRGTDNVTDVLARDERLVEVFVRHSAHFTRLRSRLMRRIMGRLATVEDAARIAAIPLEGLLRDLNDALGVATMNEPSSAMAPPSDCTSGEPARAGSVVHPSSAPVVEVDVRDDLREGREPLARILAAVGSLQDGDVLLVRAIFEPVPLFTVLGKRGFGHESIQHARDDWSVWFWRDGPGASPGVPPRQPPSGSVNEGERLTAANDANTVLLDVRGLHPPEPLVRTLAALETLPDGHQLVQINSRVPQLLLPMLAERGFACELDESDADQVLLRIWRPAGALAVNT